MRSQRVQAGCRRLAGWLFVLGGLGPLVLSGCAQKDLRLVRGANWRQYVYEHSESWGDALSNLRFRSEVCQGENLAPVYHRIDENDLAEYFRQHQTQVSIERPRTDLAYLTVAGAGTARPARLRVAILKNADEAGRELAEAIAQHGPGSWGVHRSNIAVLGPLGDTDHDLAFAARVKLVCWGVFTIAGQDDTVVIPGGYREL